MVQLSIVIVNYNVKHFLEQCLSSVMKASQGMNVEVFVVDNSSVDGSVEMVRKKFPEVHLIVNKKNVGFSRANNQALRIANGKYVLLLNPDTIVQEDTFMKCYAFMEEHEDAGALGIKMLDGKGEFLPESKRALPTPWVAFYKIFGLYRLFPKSHKFGKYHLTYLDKEQNHVVDVLSGAFMWIRKAVLEKIGYLDEDYFMYGEDVDLSYRIQQAGFHNYYFAGSQIIHYKGESTKKGSLNYVLVFYKAMLIFARKHFSKQNLSLFMVLIQLAIYFRAGLSAGKRILNTIGFPFIELLLSFGNVMTIKYLWEKNYRYVHGGAYPEVFDQLAAPIYAITFILFLVLMGAYKRPYKLRSLILGIFLGFITIATVSYLFPSINFSRAIVALASVFMLFITLLTRGIHNFFLQGHFFFDNFFNRKTLIIADNKEFERVYQLLSDELPYDCDLAGYVSPIEVETSDKCLGSLSQLPEILKIYKIQELILCNQSISTREIIQLMTMYKGSVQHFRIVPKNAQFIMGSHQVYEASPHSYLVFSKLSSSETLLKKQVFDFVVSMGLILSFPLIFWIFEYPLTAFYNILHVVRGNYHLVGYIDGSNPDLPPLKSGLLNMKTIAHYHKNASLLDKQYARYYSVGLDLQILLHGFKQLGARPNV